MPPNRPAPGHGTQYPRLTSVDFLEQCSVHVASFYRHWDAKRLGRRMPSRADFDPLEMKEWLPGIILVDVTHHPRTLTYRLVGSRSVALRASDVTGKTVEEGYHGPTLDEVLENYRLVVDAQLLVYDRAGTLARSGLMRDSETLMLPLSSDGVTVDKVIVYLEIEELSLR
ncbi:MAG: PAS domain-containing protein [Rhodospirillaceae bacterium]|nr:PAS domain-containing protein [Rhodospirillaceae bacterium]